MATINAVNTTLLGQSGTGAFAGTIGAALTTPKIDQINDTNNNGALQLTATASAVNYLNMTNGATGSGVSIQSVGTNSNIDLSVIPKGTGALTLGAGAYLAGSSEPIQMTTTTSSTLGVVGIGLWSNDANGSGISCVKSRSTSVGGTGQTIVQNGDVIMQLDGYGSNGSGTFTKCSQIITLTNAAVSGTILPTQMVFKTMNTAGSLNTSMTIGNNQIVNFNAGLTFSSSTLSTYETGNFTPSFTCATPGDLSISYATQTGRYIIIGDLVFVYYSITFTPTFSTASGTIIFAGLPFNALQSTSAINIGSISSGFTWPSSVTSPSLITVSGTGNLNLIGHKSATTSVLFSMTTIVSGAALTLIGAGSYRR